MCEPHLRDVELNRGMENHCQNGHKIVLLTNFAAPGRRDFPRKSLFYLKDNISSIGRSIVERAIQMKKRIEILLERETHFQELFDQKCSAISLSQALADRVMVQMFDAARYARCMQSNKAMIEAWDLIHSIDYFREQSMPQTNLRNAKTAVYRMRAKLSRACNVCVLCDFINGLEIDKSTSENSFLWLFIFVHHTQLYPPTVSSVLEFSAFEGAESYSHVRGLLNPFLSSQKENIVSFSAPLLVPNLEYSPDIQRCQISSKGILSIQTRRVFALHNLLTNHKIHIPLKNKPNIEYWTTFFFNSIVFIRRFKRKLKKVNLDDIMSKSSSPRSISCFIPVPVIMPESTTSEYSGKVYYCTKGERLVILDLLTMNVQKLQTPYRPNLISFFGIKWPSVCEYISQGGEIRPVTEGWNVQNRILQSRKFRQISGVFLSSSEPSNLSKAVLVSSDLKWIFPQISFTPLGRQKIGKMELDRDVLLNGNFDKTRVIQKRDCLPLWRLSNLLRIYNDVFLFPSDRDATEYGALAPSGWFMIRIRVP